jgi:hypothetical protein
MIAFSLSPGGLLLPYHLGVLASLSYHGYVTPDTHLAGSSAGAIAVASHACNVPSHVALDASIRVSSRCNAIFLARGQLMPSLRNELQTLLPKNANVVVNERKGRVGLAHLELFPTARPVLQTQLFETRNCLVDAVCDSSMFPYFTSNKPFRIVKRHGKSIPRVVVDGVFTEPLWRFGCPDIEKCLSADPNANIHIDRCVSVSVFPMELVVPVVGHIPTNLLKNKTQKNKTTTTTSDDKIQHHSHSNKIISPKLETMNVIGQVGRLGFLACTPGSRQDLIKLYEDGWEDAERWAREEEARSTRPESPTH